MAFNSFKSRSSYLSMSNFTLIRPKFYGFCCEVYFKVWVACLLQAHGNECCMRSHDQLVCWDIYQFLSHINIRSLEKKGNKCMFVTISFLYGLEFINFVSVIILFITVHSMFDNMSLLSKIVTQYFNSTSSTTHLKWNSLT